MNNTTAPGWYPVNESRELGYFDGTTWTGDRVPNPDAPPLSAAQMLDWRDWRTWVALVLVVAVLAGVVLVPVAWLLSQAV